MPVCRLCMCEADNMLDFVTLDGSWSRAREILIIKWEDGAGYRYLKINQIEGIITLK